MNRLGLRSKLTLLYTAIFTALLVVLCIAAYYLLEINLENAATDELVQRATALRGYFSFVNGEPVLVFDPNDPEVAYFVRTATRYYQVYDLAGGDLIVQSPELQLLGLGLGPDELQTIAQGPILVDFRTDQGRIRFFNDRIVSASGRVYFLQVGTSLEPFDVTLRSFGRLALFLLPLGIILSATVGSITAGRALAPIRNIARTAQEIEISQLSRRLPISGTGDDLDRLAATFNEMLERLEKTVGEMKQFTASIAHELRTPLAALRGEAEVALLHHQEPEEYRQVLTSQLEEFDKLTRMINQLLILARAESGELQLVRESFDASAMLRNVVETFSLIAAEKQIALKLDAPAVLTINSDPQWLERAVVNLLDNAVKYTDPGGNVTLRALQDRDELRIEIQDDGRGITGEALPHIFERFYRADPSRGKEIQGVGLGLSLVKWIVDRHGGTIEIASRPNQGTTFAIRLPQTRSILKH